MPLLTSGPSRFLGNRAKWYTAGGAPVPVVAYQPKGAADLAASYVNLASPGTNDAAPGTAPTFAAATGWTFLAASTQYLLTGITPTANTTVIVRYSSIVNPGIVIGSRAAAGSAQFVMIPNRSSDVGWRYGSTSNNTAPQVTAGVLAIAGGQAYRNGTAENAAMTFDAGTYYALMIGAINTAGTAGSFLSGNVLAVAIYNTILTAPQVAAVSSAMSLL